jgi:oligopeptidase A
VADTPELRAAFNAVLPKVTEFWTLAWAPTNASLPSTSPSTPPESLNHEQRQAHRNAHCATSCSVAPSCTGADTGALCPSSRSATLPQLAQKFSENALDATDAIA